MKQKLIHVTDDGPGITRRRRGRGFSYYTPDGTLIRDPEERARIEALAVPPAYEEVWISPDPRGHLQATGRDAGGRKQYRYHPDWQALRAQRKFGDLAAFGRALPRLRRRIAVDLRAPAGSRRLALAAVLALLDRAALRVGNACYAAENGSYGASTLLGRHVRFDGQDITIVFPGKHGARVEAHLQGRRLARALHRIHDLPGAALFSWRDGEDILHTLRSEDINETLHELCGKDASAKTFRTWKGTHAAFALAAQTDGALRITDMAEVAAACLHNSPAIARKSYIHPSVIALAEMVPQDRTARLAALDPPDLSGLHAHEAELIALLEGSVLSSVR
ncbi:DNA topoisomerase-1 [Lutimaribacter pacificus]|uniref:DNA topoisomerase n=1 Tax=Lutimaribacter pacificus TaxID=391948 RepID=A0A1H0LTL3_9RHOB|nr:DNA topoisomerase IB [Lutimaribacter pacificus]SDO71599.1 DNA topoisomerase-1 [Lutimaribacter pacificus]SHK03347.1 DNA topoisomerase-1 [Lutimaribacter pacificus]